MKPRGFGLMAGTWRVLQWSCSNARARKLIRFAKKGCFFGMPCEGQFILPLLLYCCRRCYTVLLALPLHKGHCVCRAQQQYDAPTVRLCTAITALLHLSRTCMAALPSM